MQDVPSGTRWIGALGLVAALAVFPLPTVGSTPEIASVVAVAAIALLAGQRWALPIVVLADVALVGALWPRAFLHDPPSQAAQFGVLLGLLGALPGLWMLGSAGSPLADVVFARPTARARRLSRVGIVVLAGVWLAMPLF
jgi:hypothetical protein